MNEGVGLAFKELPLKQGILAAKREALNMPGAMNGM